MSKKLIIDICVSIHNTKTKNQTVSLTSNLAYVFTIIIEDLKCPLSRNLTSLVCFVTSIFNIWILQLGSNSSGYPVYFDGFLSHYTRHIIHGQDSINLLNYFIECCCSFASWKQLLIRKTNAMLMTAELSTSNCSIFSDF